MRSHSALPSPILTGVMTNKPKFSSTMRIDLTADAEDGYEPAPISVAPDAVLPLPSGAQPDANQCEIVGSADFRELLQSVYDAAIITHLDGRVIRGNRRAEQFFLYDVSHFANLHITDLLSGSDAALMSTIRDSLKDDRFILIQAYCTRADKRIFPAEISVNLLHLSEHDYVSFFIRDVTLRKEAEERLRTGHAALQNSGNGIAVTDENAILQYSNPAMSALLGIESGQKPTPQITAFLSNPALASVIQETAASGQTWSGEIEMLCADGTTLFVQASVAPNVDADGQVVGMVWSLLDVSDQKRIQQELIEYNAQLAEDISLANEFQLAFIQRDYPVFPPDVDKADSALEIGHIYIPSGFVGGDFFEIFAVSENSVGIFISDVMGHGVRSALIVATIRGLIEELGHFRSDPAAFLSHMNTDLTRIIKHSGQAIFATSFYMVLDLTSGELRYAGAGHPFPILLKADHHTAKGLPHERSDIDPALGLFPSTEYRQHLVTIEPGDTLVAFTDGIAEVENADSECFHFHALASSIRHHAAKPVSDMLDGLVADAQTFSGSRRFDDDVCLVSMKFRQFLPILAS
jgi:PAS domain S-box-containing protein